MIGMNPDFTIDDNGSQFIELHQDNELGSVIKSDQRLDMTIPKLLIELDLSLGMITIQVRQ